MAARFLSKKIWKIWASKAHGPSPKRKSKSPGAKNWNANRVVSKVTKSYEGLQIFRVAFFKASGLKEVLVFNFLIKHSGLT